jgi:hypothetical protein
MNAVTTPELVLKLKSVLLTMPQIEAHTDHFFAGGMYCRRLVLNKGALVVGRIHTKAHFFMVTKGWLKVTTDGEVIDMVAPDLLPFEANTRKAVYAVEDSICMTVHVTSATNVKDAEADISLEDPDTPYGVGNILKSLEHVS